MIEVTAGLIRDLLRAQRPDLAEHPVRLGARGWAAQLWRLGDDLAVRLPWATADAGTLLRNEYTWVPALAPGLPLPVPVPQFLGEPSDLFPHPWLITTWLPGTPADQAPITRNSAHSLAAFLTALHQPAPGDAPTGQDRGGPLAERAEGFARGLAAVTELGLIDDPEAVDAVWQDALEAPAWTGPPLWLHADLHAANVLTTEGALSGIIDFGDMCAGDPAYDLSAAWLLLPDADDLLTAYRPPATAAPGPGPDGATVRRARGWAMARVLSGLLIGDAGVHGRPGGKAGWGPPARAALGRLLGHR
ncbi:aminoglycoside phosphotransferase family protein [Paractinoplanes ferrugineus]|uniref:Phosphotransferase n=1 Tax=Paractinoplanes ferrugineus TaxID=113564 RepID=A0A919J344_9ACTN|nr:phosphotransferase [Actinoplanes ferrugineus]GIE12088.1 phosphotransferase [Actinoplanes ferrugineus]